MTKQASCSVGRSTPQWKIANARVTVVCDLFALIYFLCYSYLSDFMYFIAIYTFDMLKFSLEKSESLFFRSFNILACPPMA